MPTCSESIRHKLYVGDPEEQIAIYYIRISENAKPILSQYIGGVEVCGGMARCVEVCGDVARCMEVGGGVAQCGAVHGGQWRCGAVWRVWRGAWRSVER